MTIFTQTLNQTLLLLSFVGIGYALAKANVLQQSSATVLSKLENFLFMPALVMGTFIKNFNIETLKSAWFILLISFVLEFLIIPVAIFAPKIVIKNDRYLQKISTYGLIISNFGFVGNPIMLALFPEIFFEYIIFTLPLWIVLYVWAVPKYLIPQDKNASTLGQKLKSLINPMFIGMVIGMIIGIFQIPLPDFAVSVVQISGDCMSPVGMLLTGITVSAIDLRKTFSDYKLYFITFVRLLVIPLMFAPLLKLLPIEQSTYICAICAMSMPLGINNIIVPSAYGLDTSHAAGMAIISHILCCVTIPLVFMLTI